MNDEIRSLSERLRWVVIENPMQHWHNPVVRRYFDQYIQTKKLGFEREYPSGVLPFGTYDFISNLILLEDTDSKEIVSVLKSSSLRRSNQYKLKDELGGILGACGAEAHLNVLQHFANLYDDWSYISSWTVLSQFRRKIPGLVRHFRPLSMAMMVQYHREIKVPLILTGGAVRFGVPDLLTQSLGMKDWITPNNEKLPTIHSPFLFGEETQMQFNDGINDEGLRLAELYHLFWQKREWINESQAVETHRAA